MKASILSAAALFAAGAMADALVEWFVAPLCTESSRFDLQDVPLDNVCRDFGPFLPDSARIISCDQVSDCSCDIFEARDCTGKTFDLPYSNFQPIGCDDLTNEFEFFSIRCSIGLPV